jgi:predicted nucleic acid-binding protein
MVYVDTSVLVALCVSEPQSAAVTRWYEACSDDLKDKAGGVVIAAVARAGLRIANCELHMKKGRTCGGISGRYTARKNPPQNKKGYKRKLVTF